MLAGTIDGLKGSDYHLGSETPREAAARAWTHLLATYRRFRDDLAALPDGDPAVAVTRERWLSQLFADLGYGRVPATPAGGLTAGEGAAAKQYPVSHLWGSTPIHQLGWGVDLDRRSPGVAGAARAPHAMVQELLNRTDEYLWAILTNGRTLRLLRDSTTLTGFAYVEFDLEAMFDGELFSEFALLYLLAHQSRVEVADGAAPSTCWLERWRTTAIGQGVRALTLLRDGVETALETLGTGFLQHPANTALRQSLADGAVRLSDVHAALLRTVYRLLFWAVAEDRDALLAPDATADQRARYQDYFSSARLRDLALKRHGSGHDDLWQAATLVLDALGRSGGEPRLGLPGLGGLFSTTAATCSPAPGSPTPRCSRRSGRSRWCSPRASRGGWSTSPTSAPRSSGRCTSRCWSSCPATTRSATPSRWRRWPATTARPPAATTPPPSWSSSSSTPPSTRCSTTSRSAPRPPRSGRRRCST